jgi:hypothetical protein
VLLVLAAALLVVSCILRSPSGQRAAAVPVSALILPEGDGVVGDA